MIHAYLAGRLEIERWLERSIASTVRAIRTEDEARRVPAGATWLCSTEDHARLLALRGTADTIVAVRPETVPWQGLAHDLRGPLMVIQGAIHLQEGRLQELALRGTHRLAHLAECWDAIGAPSGPVCRVKLDDVLLDACQTFIHLEPRAEAPSIVELDELELETDPNRLTLGLVRLFSHLTRVSPSRITLRAEAGRYLELRAGAPLESHGRWDALQMDELWRRSSRLALAILLLDPLTERWEIEGGVARWHPLGSISSVAPP